MMMATGLEFISDFIRCTQFNYYSLSNDKYEVTQLINSAIGLLIIPKENKNIKISDNFIDAVLLSDIKQCVKINTYAAPLDLEQIVRHLRNGIAHGRFEFEAEITSADPKSILIHKVVFKDSSRASYKKLHEDFEIEISVELLRDFFIAFSDAVVTYVDNEITRCAQRKTKKKSKLIT